MKQVMEFLRRRSVMQWGCEIAGVAVLAVGAWMIYAPVGVIVAALYLILVANSGGGSDASDRTSS